MRVSREISDTIELIEKLRARFGRQQIILVGHSYGSSLGVRVAARRPDLIRAYVGIGQLACSHDEYIRLQDAWIAKQAKERGDTNVYKHAIAGDSYDRETALFRYGGEIENSTSFWSLVKIGLRAPEYSLIDVYDVKKGVDFTHANLQDDVGKPDVPLMKEDTKLGVPVFFFEGRQDYTDPSACAEQYFQQLHAPYKRIVWFEHSAHFPFLEETAKFASALDQVAEETSARRRSGTNAN